MQCLYEYNAVKISTTLTNISWYSQWHDYCISHWFVFISTIPPSCGQRSLAYSSLAVYTALHIYCACIQVKLYYQQYTILRNEPIQLWGKIHIISCLYLLQILYSTGKFFSHTPELRQSGSAESVLIHHPWSRGLRALLKSPIVTVMWLKPSTSWSVRQINNRWDTSTQHKIVKYYGISITIPVLPHPTSKFFILKNSSW